MTAVTFELDPVTVAVREWLQTEIEVEVEDSIAAEDPPASYAVLFQLGSPRTAPGPMTGQTIVEITYQVTSVGIVPSQARVIGDRVRVAFVGTDGAGVYTRELDLDGFTVLRRESNNDGALDVVKGIPQWAETFRLMLAPGEPAA